MVYMRALPYAPEAPAADPQQPQGTNGTTETTPPRPPQHRRGASGVRVTRTVGLPNTTEQLRTNYLLKNFLQEIISLQEFFPKEKNL